MYRREYDQALKLAIDLHKKYRNKINPAVRDVKLAAYYLQGGALSEALRALRAWSEGDLLTPGRSKRYIDECRELVMSFAIVQEPQRYLKHFFNDEITSINLTKHLPDAELKGISPEIIRQSIKSQKPLNRGFSKVVHPTLNSLAYNSDPNTGEYLYDTQSLAYTKITGFDFGPFLIVPTIDTVTTNSLGYFGIPKEEYTQLDAIRAQIHERSVEQLRKSRRFP